jgi:hypothetical protein
MHAPSRILWYVVNNQNYFGTKKLRACSFLEEVVVGRAKDLYARFKRLGIYRWEDVLETADGDPNNHIMALRFRNTEILRHPVTLKTIYEVLTSQDGKQPFLQAPQHISEGAFSRLYGHGVLGKKE